MWFHAFCNRAYEKEHLYTFHANGILLWHMSRRKNPYTVVPLKFPYVFDLKDLAEKTCRNMKRTISGSTVNWMKIKWIHFDKAHSDEIRTKTSFDQDKFDVIKVTPSIRGRPSTQLSHIKQLYSSKRPISKEKKANLLFLCTSRILPSEHRAFYENLASSGNAKNTDGMMEEDEYCWDIISWRFWVYACTRKTNNIMHPVRIMYTNYLALWLQLL